MNIWFLCLALYLLLCIQSFARVVIDDFSFSSWPINGFFSFQADHNSYPAIPYLDFSLGTPLNSRSAYVYLDSGPGYINAQITSGVMRVTTTDNAIGGFSIKNYSAVFGRYADLSDEYVNGGGITLSFATSVQSSLPMTLTVWSESGGRLDGIFSIPGSVSEFHAPFSAFSVTGAFSPSMVLRTECLFTDIGPGNQLNIDSISVVPEPTVFTLFAVTGLLLFSRRRGTCLTKPF